MKTNRLRHVLLTWFTFTRAEKHAAILLSGILLISQSVLWYRIHYGSTVATVHADQTLDYSAPFTTGSSMRQEKATSDIQLQIFDPDTVSVFTLKKFGMSERQAESMIRFRERAGGFHQLSDLQKVRVLSPGLLEKWTPYLRFSERKNDSAITQRTVHSGKQMYHQVDINNADTLLLQTLPLIGSGRAKAIVSYRERLGGYLHINQLLELKAIPDSVFRAIEKRVVCGKVPVRQLAINKLPADSIRHPYLPKPLGRLIVSYREQHGPFTSLKDLENLPLVNAEILTKIAPYLNLNP